MLTEKFLRHRCLVGVDADDHAILDGLVIRVDTLAPRTTLVRQGERLHYSTLLLDGFMSRHVDDRAGNRQLVSIHVPGDFVDLHGYPMHELDHDLGSLTAARVAVFAHGDLDRLIERHPALGRKLWFSTLLDAAIHRQWLFRLGRLDAVGRVSHLLCETEARLRAIGLSDGRRFTLPLTQSDVAEICGLTNVHVNRVLRQLREERLCTFRSRVVDIAEPQRLAARGQFDPAYLYLD